MFLVAAGNQDKVYWIERMINKHVSNAKVFTAIDGLDASSKLSNLPPHVLITEIELPKTAQWKMIEHAMTLKAAEQTAIIILGLPTEGRYMDEMVAGKVQYFTTEDNEVEFDRLLAKALNFSSHKEPGEFYLKFIAPDDLLIREGEKADCVYLVKKGQLKAFKHKDGADIELGKIEVGEFVGEMAYINGEPRSASVTAITDCELIEVPLGTFDTVLFKRPAWAKALMMTLAKRIKAANTSRQ